MSIRERVRVCCLILLAYFASLAFSASSALSQETDTKLPSANEVIEQHILAKGGYEYLASLTSMHVVWNKSDGPNEWQFERWRTLRRKFSKRSLNGQLEQSYGCWVADDPKTSKVFRGVSWRQQGQQPALMLRGLELQESLQNTLVVDEATLWVARSSSIRVIGKKKVGNSDCYHLKFTDLEGAEMDRFFDIESGYLICQVGVEHQSGQSVVTRTYANHKQFGDIVVATKQTINSVRGTDIWEIESFEYDTEIDFDQFDVPELVQATINEMELRLRLAEDNSLSR